MNRARLNVVIFDDNDVIATSTFLKISGTLNGVVDDAVFTIIADGVSTNYTSTTLTESVFNDVFGDGMYKASGILQKADGTGYNSNSIRNLCNYDNNKQKYDDYVDKGKTRTNNAYNNTYLFDSLTSKFICQ